jgi:hypothetical protein
LLQQNTAHPHLRDYCWKDLRLSLSVQYINKNIKSQSEVRNMLPDLFVELWQDNRLPFGQFYCSEGLLLLQSI